MPELPDLLYIRRYAETHIAKRTITGVEVREPVIIRNAVDLTPDVALIGTTIARIGLHGPFIRFELSGMLDLVLNLMLAGRLQHQHAGERAEGYRAFSLSLDDGTRLNLCDEQKMAKAYLVKHGAYGIIPRYLDQGVDILSPEFTLSKFRVLAAQHSRKQVRVFINDHTILSSIGNAYADEILFEARIHPKTFVTRLAPDQIAALYSAIRSVIHWGIRCVSEAGQPIHVKVREHMKVRNRKGLPCARCGGTIRREGVRGHDVFFCPRCQPASRKHFIDWNSSADTR